MHRNSALISALGMALFFCVVSLGSALVSAGANFNATGNPLPLLVHVGGICLASVLLAFFLSGRAPGREFFRRRGRAEWTLTVLLTASMLICFVLPFSLSGGTALSWELLLFPAFALGLYLPVAVHAFCAFVPQRHQGFVLGCCMAVGYLVWIIVLPLVHLAFALPDADEPILYIYIYKLLGFAMAGVGFCNAWAFWNRQPRNDLEDGRAGQTAGHDAGADSSRAAAGRSGARRALVWLFTAAGFYYLLFGMMLLEMPRAADKPLLPGNLHFILLLPAPAAGLLLDKALAALPGSAGKTVSPLMLYLGALLAPAVAGAALLGFLDAGGASIPLSVYLLAVREVFLLLILVTAGRLAAKSPWLPLLGGLAWSLLVLHLPGILLGRWLGPLNNNALAAAVALAAACIFCLWIFGRIAQGLPGMAPPLAREEAPEEAGAGRPWQDDKFPAFAGHFDLTIRETEILQGVLREEALDALGDRLGISERTVRFHLSGILRKTGQVSRRRLVFFYATWTPEGI